MGMGAFLLSAGQQGKRYGLPNSRIMIHQPLGGTQGQAADIEIQANEILHHKLCLNGYLSEFTGQDMATITKDADRDNFMSAAEAKEYGLIDDIIVKPGVEPPTPELHNDVVNQPVLLGLRSGHEVVAVRVLGDGRHVLPRELRKVPVEAELVVQDLVGLDLDVRGLPLRAAQGLVDHDAAIGEPVTLALLPRGEQEGPHRGGQPPM